MNRYSCLLDAVEVAVTKCNHWKFYISNEYYDSNSLLRLAETADSEGTIDEDSFYVVGDNGAIGICVDEENIEWQFITTTPSDNSLPTTLQPMKTVEFCPSCGTRVTPGAHFCDNCGNKL